MHFARAVIHRFNTIGRALYSDAGLFLAFFLLLFALLHKEAALPPAGDDLYIVCNTAYRILHGHYRGSDPDFLQNSDPGHPYLFPALIAAGWKVVGVRMAWPHLPTLAFSALGLLYTFKLGRYFFGYAEGISAAALLLCNGMFVSSAAMIQLNIPSLAAFVMAFYYQARRKPVHFVFCLSALALFKATGVIFAFGLFLADAIWTAWALRFQPWSRRIGALFRSAALFSAAPLVFALFCLARRWMTGHYLLSPNYQMAHQMNLPDSLAGLAANFKMMAWDKFLMCCELYILAAFSLAFLLAQGFLPQRAPSPGQKPFQASLGGRRGRGAAGLFWAAACIPTLVMVIFFSIRTEGNLVTYYLPLYPMLYLGFSAALWRCAARSPRILKPVALAILLILGAGFAVRWKNTWVDRCTSFSPALSRYLKATGLSHLGYTEYSAALVRAARYAETYHPDAAICSTYPERNAFAWPWAGFVHKQFQVFEDGNGDTFPAITHYYRREGKKILVITSRYPWQVNPDLLATKFPIQKSRVFRAKSMGYAIEAHLLVP